MQSYSTKSGSEPYAWHARLRYGFYSLYCHCELSKQIHDGPRVFPLDYSRHSSDDVTFDELWGILGDDHYTKEVECVVRLS